MAGAVKIEIQGNLAIIEISNPPVNAISQAIRSGLLNCVSTAEEHPAVEAIILVGAGKHFIAGADIREFNLPPAEPHLPQVINQIESSSKPVIAALAGSVLGGGLEVAMGAHYRVALPSAKLGLPEVSLGLIPGAGGTQRLPRLVGVDDALTFITSGKPVSAEEAVAIGLADELSGEAGARAAGVAFARKLVASGAGPKPVSALECDPLSEQDAANWRAKLEKRARGQIAPLKCLDAVLAAAKLPFAEGLAKERAMFLELRDSDQRAALSHVFFAERSAAKLPELNDVAVRDLQKIGVVGGGTMGAGIAVSCLLNGFDVSLVERDADSAERALGTVTKTLSDSVKRGRLPEDGFDRMIARFSSGSEYAAFSDADVVIEAVFESIEVKEAVFTELDKVCRQGCILASNTSYLDLNQIAALTNRPQDVIGLHFFSPAHIMKLLEIVVSDTTSPEVVATGFHLAKRLGKVGVRSGVCDGFIGNRLLMRYRLAADAVVLAGASPYDVDRAVKGFGFPMGPYAVGDLAGLDIAWATRKRRAATRDPRELVAGYLDRLCEMGRFGQKTGRGYYIYEEGVRGGKPDPEVLEVIAEERASRGISARTFLDEEIAERYLFAMINEACNILDEGIAKRPLDVDLTLIHGYGFPRWRGGPMHYADTIGLPVVLHKIKGLQAEDEWFWRPAPLLERMVAEGKSFSDFNS